MSELEKELRDASIRIADQHMTTRRPGGASKIVRLAEWYAQKAVEQLRADNAVLAAEVRAWRVLFSSASRGAGNWFKNRKEADQQMAKTDVAGALERDGGGR